jgi:hypothetical protein
MVRELMGDNGLLISYHSAVGVDVVASAILIAVEFRLAIVEVGGQSNIWEIACAWIDIAPRLVAPGRCNSLWERMSVCIRAIMRTRFCPIATALTVI